jgi:hypothetical protein
MLAKKNETLVEIGKKLRAGDEDITHEPLPGRWVELIKCLNEKERKRSDRRQPEFER